MIIEFTEIESPIGGVTAACVGQTLVALQFADSRRELESRLGRRFGDISPSSGRFADEAAARLRDYFAGDMRAIDSLSVDPGGTPFQERVWAQLRRIGAGQTASYRDVAKAIGAPIATRAVGAANGANPIGIVIPCHRVIGANGTLTGYGGGIDRKRWLLAHEGAVLSL